MLSSRCRCGTLNVLAYQTDRRRAKGSNVISVDRLFGATIKFYLAFIWAKIQISEITPDFIEDIAMAKLPPPGLKQQDWQAQIDTASNMQVASFTPG
ncbi:hypothetical protein [Bradyrhizobium sp. RP6]|uniref:hypothetical protein n=1 Tax=Bradyrhizobium sp. RP6 TaxID=2489596 RepID=UPI000F528118|nr:hypothetical protein [Bradyrhizobium sp. RP6]RQH11842.1 hypothetical protein EHH60_19245 [Bradyrhizobium sp. RP6]